MRNVPTNNPFYGKISNNSFAEIAPKSLGSQPTVTFNIDNVLSKVGYDIYVVFAPALAYDTLATDEQRLPKIKIFTDVSSNQTSKYQTTMRIDCIIVRPHDAPVSEAREIKISY